MAASSALAGDSCHDAYWNSTAAASLVECRASADSGNAQSQFGYALVLWSGHGEIEDRNEALKWFRSAARQGHTLSRVVLGRFLSSDEVAPELRNRAEGYAWWVVAGESGAAADLRKKLSADEVKRGEHLVQEFRGKP